MASSDGRYVISYNGEIYNFPELKRLLEKEGARFRSTTDTEVLLEGFSRWGHEDLLSRLNGMFAFAIWDRRDKRLLLARDRFGVKPLVLYRGKGFVAFGSTLTSLLPLPGVERVLRPEAISYYLQSFYVPSQTSIFDKFEKVQPSTWLSIDADGHSTTGRFWNPVLRSTPRRSEGEYLEEFEFLLEAAVKRRLVADVPVGVFLSGGIDSSLVATYAVKHKPGIKTFTIGFQAKEFDESAIASRVAAHLGTDHQEESLEPRALLDRVESVARSYDEPFADASAIPTLLLSEMTRRQVTVALSGDGGDELFGGYSYHRWIALFALLRRAVPYPFRKWTSRLAELPLPYRTRLIFRAASLESLPEIYAYLRGPTKEVDLSELLANDAPASLGRFWKERLPGPPNSPSTYGLLDFLHYLVDDINVKVDRASMAHSLEVRSPFLDVSVVDWILNVPYDLRLHRGESKYLSRRLLERHVPKDITQLPKRGFGVPIRLWLKGELRDEVQELGTYDWSSLHIRGDYVRRLIREHLDGRRIHDSILWALWILSRWFEVNRSGPQAPLPELGRTFQVPVHYS